MSIRNLDKLFRPQSVAVIGASNRPGSVGCLVMRNLLQAGFQGPIMPVNPKHKAVAGVLAYADVEALPEAPDMAVICTPAATVPAIVETLGARGTRAATVLTAGLARAPASEDDGGRSLQDVLLDKARQHDMRLLGPNCLGLLVPGIGLNASFAHLPALAGRIAFVSQSGALCTAVLDWARSRHIGFSHFVSLGDCADISFGDVIDYLSTDADTSAILLYIESIRQRRNFMSAARAAARNKPVIAIKAGRAPEGARAAASHTGALAGVDEVYDAAFRRAGMLRVYDIDELFDAVETLARSRPLRGDRLAVLTNGGGIGVLAVDTLSSGGGSLASLDKRTIAALDAVLPDTWSGGNPVDIIGDAPGERYAKALDILLAAKEVDAVLVMHAPTGTADSVEAAQAVVEAGRNKAAPLLTNWVGGETVAPARHVFHDAGVPTYDTPDQAVRAFLHMLRYRRNQEMLMETPAAAPEAFQPVTATARLVIQSTLAEAGDGGDVMMSEPEAKAVLAAYGIPTVETHVVAGAEEAVRAAATIDGPVALKILSPDISHKSDVGGVALHLETDAAVRGTAEEMLARVEERFPKARISGFTVQRMAQRAGAHELIVGVTTDAIFGPVILFGEGGTAVEVIGDRAIGLPPLNMTLAREIIGRTRIRKLLAGYRDRPAADIDAICLTLMQIAQLVIDMPEIAEIDINPLLADADGVLALDARIRLASPTVSESARLAIRPYPGELEEKFALRSGRTILLRPIRPEDEPEHYAFLSKLTPEDIRFRFFGLIRDVPHSQMARLTQIDYDREMAFIATDKGEDGQPETLGVVRTITDPDNVMTEFAIVVRSDQKGQGLGSKLLQKMIDYCRARGTERMVGQVLRGNRAMLALAERLGFKVTVVPGDDAVEVVLPL